MRADELARSSLSPGGKNKQTTPLPNKIQGYRAQQVCFWQKFRGLMSSQGPAGRYKHSLQEHPKNIWGSLCDPQQELGLALMAPLRCGWDTGGAGLQEDRGEGCTPPCHRGWTHRHQTPTPPAAFAPLLPAPGDVSVSSLTCSNEPG